MKYYDKVCRGLDLEFEEWRERGVLKAQRATWQRAAELKVTFPRFRCLPKYRDEPARLARDMVALSVRMDRLKARIAQYHFV